jgi:hypothetical protein
MLRRTYTSQDTMSKHNVAGEAKPAYPSSLNECEACEMLFSILCPWKRLNAEYTNVPADLNRL